jgi:hypothetical protein
MGNRPMDPNGETVVIFQEHLVNPRKLCSGSFAQVFSELLRGVACNGSQLMTEWWSSLNYSSLIIHVFTVNDFRMVLARILFGHVKGCKWKSCPKTGMEYPRNDILLVGQTHSSPTNLWAADSRPPDFGSPPFFDMSRDVTRTTTSIHQWSGFVFPSRVWVDTLYIILFNYIIMLCYIILYIIFL